MPDAELREAMGALDTAFAEGRLEELTAFIAHDARLLLHHQKAVVGKEAVRASFAAIFAGFDTSAYKPSYEVTAVHGDRAYVIASFEEVLRARAGQPGIQVHGRMVQFWRRDEDREWRIVVLLTARSAPDELTA